MDIKVEALQFRKRIIQGSVTSLDEQIADSSKVNEEKLKLQDKFIQAKRIMQNLNLINQKKMR